MKTKLYIEEITMSYEATTKRKPKRKSGYYRVKSFDDRWYIAQFISPSTWLKFNDPDFYKDENFKEIGQEIII